MRNKFSPSTIIATFFGIGFIPVAPGTFGSLVAFPVYFLLNMLVIQAMGGVANIASPSLINSLMSFIAILFFVGIWAADQYCKRTGKNDPKEIVIDEVVGQLVAICLTILMLPYVAESLIKFEQHGINEFNFIMLNLLSIFILFRIFDIAKPWPINYIDKNYKSGFGVMLDDVVAAILAVIVHYFILFAIIDRL